MSQGGFRPTIVVRWIMLAAAYAPLLVLLAVLDSFGTQWVRWGLGAVAVAAVIATVSFLLVAVPHRNAIPEEVYSAKPREGEALKFLASYVVPFFVTTTATAPTRWGLGVYLVLIALLYLHDELYFANPVVAMLRYRVFELTRIDRVFLLVLTRERQLVPGQVVRLAQIGSYVYVHELGEGLRDGGDD